MTELSEFSITTAQNARYGPLQTGFSYSMGTGYQVLAGTNNSGKSALLQLAFLNAIDSFGSGAAALLLSDRDFVMGTTETGGQTFDNHNTQLAGSIRSAPRRFESQDGPASSQLGRLFLTHTDFIPQMQRLNDYLERLGMPTSVTRGGQTVHFEDVPLPQQGSGLRSVFSIVAALTDGALRIVCIDEPELALEPHAQRLLRDLLMEVARNGRTVLVATHSHLFLNRASPAHNHVVRRAGELVAVDAVKDEAALYDLAFRLLGNSTADLWFPSNYWVVEGASDQAIAERILAAISPDRAREVKVVAAGGIDRVKNVTVALEDALRPLVMRGSPYADRVVALVDQSVDVADGRFAFMGGRFFQLPEASLEHYLPEELYQRAGRDKGADLEELARRRGDYQALALFKRQISEQVAAVIEPQDAALLPEFRDAASRALAPPL